jgi:hypothetical protein
MQSHPPGRLCSCSDGPPEVHSMLYPKRRPVVALMRQSRSPSAIVACQGDTVGHRPGHLGFLGP